MMALGVFGFSSKFFGKGTLLQNLPLAGPLGMIQKNGTNE